jgi:uncharacterized protein DUF4439
VTSPDATSSPAPTRPSDAADAALFDAVTVAHGVIYGYGLVSAHATPDLNDLVSEALAEHREQREDGIARLTARHVTPPIPAVGYQMPFTVANPTDAEKLGVRMEEDSATAWRAVLEQATAVEDRQLAVKALTTSAVLAAKWRGVLGVVPITVAFPGGSET